VRFKIEPPISSQPFIWGQPLTAPAPSTGNELIRIDEDESVEYPLIDMDNL
jgi:hypothetical protein